MACCQRQAIRALVEPLGIDVMLNLQALTLCHSIVKAGDSKSCGSLTYQNTFGLLL